MERNAERSRWPTALALLFVLVAAVLPYWGALSAAFVLDDVPIVRDNPLIRDVRELPRLAGESYWAPHDRLNLYRPLTVASLAVNRALTGPDPPGFHAGNLALHALASALVLGVALRLGAGLGGSLAAALLFAVHPLHSEPVIEIVGRSEILAAAFALVALWLHSGSRHSLLTNALAAMSFLAALLAKEIAIGVVPAFLAFDLAERRFTVATLRGYLLHALALLGYLGLRLHALGIQQVVSPTVIAKLDNPLVGTTIPTRLMTAGELLGRYLGLTFWPATLSADYSHAAIPPAHAWTPLGAIAIALAVAAAWWGFRACRRREASVATALALFLGSYFIVSNAVILIGTIFAERLFYLPSTGLALLLASVLPSSRRGATIALAAAVAASVALGWRSAERTRDFRDERTLLAKTVATTPRSVRARIYFAYLLLREGDVDGARVEVDAAMKVDPELSITWLAASRILGTHDMAGATAAVQRALALDPASVEARVSLAAIYVYTGRNELAITELGQVLQRRPENAEARISLVEALLALGRIDEAEAEVRHLLRHRPDLAMSNFLDGRVQAARGARDAAVAAFRRGLAIQPDHAGALRELQHLTSP